MLEMAHNYAKGGTTGIAITALALAGVDLLRRGGLGGLLGDDWGSEGHHGGHRHEFEENTNLKIELAKKDSLIADLAVKNDLDCKLGKAEAQIKELKEDVRNLTRFFNITPTFVTAAIPAAV